MTNHLQLALSIIEQHLHLGRIALEQRRMCAKVQLSAAARHSMHSTCLDWASSLSLSNAPCAFARATQADLHCICCPMIRLLSASALYGARACLTAIIDPGWRCNLPVQDSAQALAMMQHTGKASPVNLVRQRSRMCTHGCSI